MLKVNIFDMRIHDLIDVDQELVTITSGYNFTEGPIWDSKRKVFIFSDIPESKLWQWSEKEGATLLKAETNKGNGNCFDHLGRIISCATNRYRRIVPSPTPFGSRIIRAQNSCFWQASTESWPWQTAGAGFSRGVYVESRL